MPTKKVPAVKSAKLKKAVAAAKPKPKVPGLLKIATFNANSIRARLPILLDWLKKEQPDVLALQETKVQDHEFPKEAIEAAGWNIVFHGQKSYNGVAFISKKPVENIEKRLYPKDAEEQARFLIGDYQGVRLINTYVPQGFEIESDKYKYKMKFYADLKKYFEKNIADSRPALWMGDLNVAPTEIDLNNPKGNLNHPCYHIDARNALKETMGSKWTDLFREQVKEGGHYTFWDMRQPGGFQRNLGWRIDFILGTAPMVGRLSRIWIDKEPRGLERPSDHTFLVAEFKI
jgi:exodeoxyribonuclease-3